MTARWMIPIVALLVLPFPGESGQTAQMQARCLSLKFNRGSGAFGLYSLDLTTVDPGVNGELGYSFFDTYYSHGCWLNVNDEIYGGYYEGAMALDPPPFADANDNGFHDFFETSQPGYGTSYGQYDLTFDYGDVEAYWSRAAGSSVGTCVLVFLPNPFQESYRFTHSFELIEYAGPIDYEPGATHVAAAVDLSRLNTPAATLTGPLDILKLSSDPANALQIQPGTITDEMGQSLHILQGNLDRDSTWPTNYYGVLEFQDGFPMTSADDYYYWEISIDDLNDADGDGIPDFSDDPFTSPPTAPRLAVELGTTNVVLTVTGEVGRLHTILAAEALLATGWQTNLTVTLTNNPQRVFLPRPNATTFWRATAY